MNGKTASRLVQTVSPHHGRDPGGRSICRRRETALELADAMGWHDFRVTRASSEGIPELEHPRNTFNHFPSRELPLV